MLREQWPTLRVEFDKPFGILDLRCNEIHARQLSEITEGKIVQLPLRFRELLLPLVIIASILVILIPLPPGIIDLLLIANITLAVVVLLSTIQAKSPLELSVFPTLLLVATLGRLVLNVATTRLILTNGAENQVAAAGGVIQNFGQFVAGDHLVVGMILFGIIVVIQFVVITKGATRISEVAARFSLDGLPGKQMAIDADLNAGMIDQKQAQQRRQELGAQADFYGAMDGASKFVRGDAIAGVLITGINLLGGLAIGLMSGMSINDAVASFCMLTIGDGLASQIPAFLIALAAAMLITRSSERSQLSTQFVSQLFSKPQVLVVAAMFLVILSFTQLPWIPLFAIGFICISIAFVMNQAQRSHQPIVEKPPEEGKSETERLVEDCLANDPIEFELGVDLIQLADVNRGGRLLEKIAMLRREFAADMGVILPRVRVRDNLDLARCGYRINIQQLSMASGTVYLDHIFVMAPAASARSNLSELFSHGINDINPYTGEVGLWIRNSQLERAVDMDLKILTPTEFLISQLKATAKKSAASLLTREATSHLVQQLRADQPSVVDELIPELLSIGQVQTVLQNLLREYVPIRQFQLILETLADHSRLTTDLNELTERVRERLAPYICQRLANGEQMRILRFDAASKQRLKDQILLANHGGKPDQQDWEPSIADEVLNKIAQAATRKRADALVVEPHLRRRMQRLVSQKIPQLAVLSETEIPLAVDCIEIETLGIQV